MIQWRIKYRKDIQGNYLFLTWQNNWQIQLAKQTNIHNPDYNLIQNLDYIKDDKENIFYHSNMSFETIISKMIYINNNTIKRLGGEPNELAIGAIKFFIFL